MSYIQILLRLNLGPKVGLPQTFIFASQTIFVKFAFLYH